MIAAYRWTHSHLGWLGLRVGSHLTLSRHSSNETGELLQSPRYGDSTINIVSVIIIIIIITISLRNHSGSQETDYGTRKSLHVTRASTKTSPTEPAHLTRRSTEAPTALVPWALRTQQQWPSVYIQTTATVWNFAPFISLHYFSRRSKEFGMPAFLFGKIATLRKKCRECRLKCVE